MLARHSSARTVIRDLQVLTDAEDFVVGVARF